MHNASLSMFSYSYFSSLCLVELMILSDFFPVTFFFLFSLIFPDWIPLISFYSPPIDRQNQGWEFCSSVALFPRSVEPRGSQTALPLRGMRQGLHHPFQTATPFVLAHRSAAVSLQCVRKVIFAVGQSQDSLEEHSS